MASSVWDAITATNLFVAFIAVTGFIEKKRSLSSDYIYIVEVFWSDGRTTYIKRTYREFLKLQKGIAMFIKNTLHIEEGGEKTCIPKLEGRRWYRRYNRKLAESRELELHQFAKDLLQANPQISSCNSLIGFLESRSEDPEPHQEVGEVAEFFEAEDFESDNFNCT